MHSLLCMIAGMPTSTVVNSQFDATVPTIIINDFDLSIGMTEEPAYVPFEDFYSFSPAQGSTTIKPNSNEGPEYQVDSEWDSISIGMTEEPSIVQGDD